MRGCWFVTGAFVSACLSLFGTAALAQNPAPAVTPPMTQPVPASGTNGTNNPGMSQPGTMPTANDTTQVRIDDKKFVQNAVAGGMTEIELGNLASQKAASDALKQFGQKMVDDHTKANGELKQIAGQQNVTLPVALDAKHQARIAKLAKLSGAAFDKAYVKDQLKDHEQDVQKFQLETQMGTDPAVKAFASKTLPILQEHLTMIKNLSAQGKNASKAGK